jgi:UDP-2-acetamido-2-deoxy-ribo-hexuluronate aminotransferase
MFDPTRHYQKKKIEYDERIQKVINEGRFINGPEVKEIEGMCSRGVRAKYGIGVASGTDALLIALMALDIGPGDDVITVPFTWISTAEVIKLLGANPVFCDIDPDTFLMDPESLSRSISIATKAIIPVSLFGQMYDVDGIKEAVKPFEEAFGYSIAIIEDAAQSYGAYDTKNRRSGGVGTIACTSFFPTKPLGCYGDGGMCFTNNHALAEKMRAIRNHGCLKRYEYQHVGVNGRLDTLQAAVLLVKFKYLDDFIPQRTRHANAYRTGLQDIAEIQLPVVSTLTKQHAYAQFTIKLKDEETRDALKVYLKQKGVDSSIFYPVCLHLVECITSAYNRGELPVSEDCAKRVLSLPMYPELTVEERDYVVSCVRNFFTKDSSCSSTDLHE